MLEKDAIQLLQENGHLPELIEQLNGTSNPLAMVPSSMSIESLERYMPNRSSFRQKFATENIPDFVRYANEYADPKQSICAVNGESMNAEIIFDTGTTSKPLHKLHKASLQLKRTAAFREVEAACVRHLDQKSASDLLEDWEEIFTVVDSDGTNIPVKAAAAILRDLTIEAAKTASTRVHDFGESEEGMASIEAKAKGEQKLPAFIHVHCTPYFGLSERTLTLRVGIITDSKPKISLRLIQSEALKESIAEEFKKLLQDELGEVLSLYIGNID